MNRFFPTFSACCRYRRTHHFVNAASFVVMMYTVLPRATYISKTTVKCEEEDDDDDDDDVDGSGDEAEEGDGRPSEERDGRPSSIRSRARDV